MTSDRLDIYERILERHKSRARVWQYPFRDGTITVAFAEITVWKEKRGAQFQLRRKNPIQGQTSYLLGKQI
jgi:hypothetical protein